MTDATEIFTEDETREILRWKKLSYNVINDVLQIPLFYQFCLVMAGGVYTSWYHKEAVKDIDIFVLSTRKSTDFYQYLTSVKMKDVFVKDSFGESQYKKNNKNISAVFEGTVAEHKFQFIFTNYKTREELISHFDFLHCTPNYHDEQMYVRKDAFNAICYKKLIVHNENNQVEWRKDKFLKHRGFTLPKETKRAPIDWNAILKWGVDESKGASGGGNNSRIIQIWDDGWSDATTNRI